MKNACNNRRFTNPHIQDKQRSFLAFLLWKFGCYDDKIFDPAPKDFSFPFIPKPANSPRDTVKWINHSTILIKKNDVHILTDPIWSKRCSPLSFFGPKRKFLPPLGLEELPKIDLVLISHDHYDHLDLATVQRLHRLFPNIHWCVPAKVRGLLEKEGISSISECNWWDQIDLSFPSCDLKITAVPAQHFSGRSGRDLNATLWAGWVVEFKNERPKQLYFAGDTGYNPIDFKKIGERWKQFDLSLIPIGSYLPRKFMSAVHVEPEDAVRIHQEVRSQLSIATHWKTFDLADEPMNQPPYDLWKALQKLHVDPSSFFVLDPGYEISW